MPDFVMQTAQKPPADTEHVDGGAQRTTAKTVFGLTEPPGAMVHRNFDEPIACASNQRGDESVHAFKRDQRVRAFATHRLERATGVAHVIFGEPAANKIRDATGQTL